MESNMRAGQYHSWGDNEKEQQAGQNCEPSRSLKARRQEISSAARLPKITELCRLSRYTLQPKQL